MGESMPEDIGGGGGTGLPTVGGGGAGDFDHTWVCPVLSSVCHPFLDCLWGECSELAYAIVLQGELGWQVGVGGRDGKES